MRTLTAFGLKTTSRRQGHHSKRWSLWMLYAVLLFSLAACGRPAGFQGADVEEALASNDYLVVNTPALNHDGSKFAFSFYRVQKGMKDLILHARLDDIAVYDLKAGRIEILNKTRPDFRWTFPSFSPDGSKIALTSSCYKYIKALERYDCEGEAKAGDRVVVYDLLTHEASYVLQDYKYIKTWHLARGDPFGVALTPHSFAADRGHTIFGPDPDKVIFLVGRSSPGSLYMNDFTVHSVNTTGGHSDLLFNEAAGGFFFTSIGGHRIALGQRRLFIIVSNFAFGGDLYLRYKDSPWDERPFFYSYNFDKDRLNPHLTQKMAAEMGFPRISKTQLAASPETDKAYMLALVRGTPGGQATYQVVLEWTGTGLNTVVSSREIGFVRAPSYQNSLDTIENIAVSGDGKTLAIVASSTRSIGGLQHLVLVDLVSGTIRRVPFSSILSNTIRAFGSSLG